MEKEDKVFEIKHGLQKEVEVKGKKYLIQKIPFYSYVQLTDRHKNKHGVLMQAPYVKELFDHCVIQPKVQMSDFDDDFEVGQMLIDEIESFFRNK